VQESVLNYVFSGGDLTLIDMVNADLDEEGQALLREYRGIAAKAGVDKVSAIMIRSADPPKALVEKLVEISPNLVVVGETSKTGFVKQLLVGSTTKYIREHVTCPLEVVEHDLEKQ
jgi:nucleotide-binding universal stress UspA family protein